MTYIILYALVGFALGNFHYWRNKAKDIGAVAEIVAIMLIWPVMGIIYIIEEVNSALGSEDDDA